MIIKLLVAFGVLILVALMTVAVLRRRDDGKVDGIWQSLEATSTHQVFTEDIVSDLPTPARRYLLHAIRPGTLLASSVRLEMHGTMRLKPEQEWMPMKAPDPRAAERLRVARGGWRRPDALQRRRSLCKW